LKKEIIEGADFIILENWLEEFIGEKN
jgi:hypothetical protein